MNEVINIEKLCLKYKDKVILEDASIKLYRGDVCIIEGSNGAGKSTFLKSLLGIERSYREESGEIKINGSKNILSMNSDELQKLRRDVCYLEQKDYFENFLGYTVFEILKDSYSVYKGSKLNNEDIEFIKTTFYKYNKNLSFDLKTKVRKLSGGQGRLLSIISTICLRKDSSVFIVDEPLNNLDLDNVVKISNLLNEIVRTNEQAVFLIVSHCRIFPFINKTIAIENKKLLNKGNNFICHSCFGQHDEDGFY